MFDTTVHSPCSWDSYSVIQRHKKKPEHSLCLRLPVTNHTRVQSLPSEHCFQPAEPKSSPRSPIHDYILREPDNTMHDIHSCVFKKELPVKVTHPVCRGQPGPIHYAICWAVLSHSVLSESWRPCGLKPTRLLCRWSRLQCPSRGDLPDPRTEPSSPTLQADSLSSEPPGKPKNTGVGSLSLLQGFFPIQESQRGLPHCRRILYQLSCQGGPIML